MTKQSELSITPALSKDVSFTNKVQVVDGALKNRAVAQKNIKLKWAVVMRALHKYNRPIPARRPDAIGASAYVGGLLVFKPLPKELENEELTELARNSAHELRTLSNRPLVATILEDKFPGFADLCREVTKVSELMVMSRRVDEKATTKAKAEMQKAVDAYIKTLEDYDETVDSIANVREYIGIVKDVAEISAIAQGRQDSNGK